jgi:hypothetical protein
MCGTLHEGDNDDDNNNTTTNTRVMLKLVMKQ